jgi:hypothetical protein
VALAIGKRPAICLRKRRPAGQDADDLNLICGASAPPMGREIDAGIGPLDTN